MNSEKSQNKLFIIHDIKVNTGENYLIKQSEAVVLEPKIMMLLSYLIEHAGEVVSRDQLLNNVWTGSIVSDNAVNWSISQLRKVLDDKSNSPRFIKTISKKGYQFIAPVAVIDTIEQPPIRTTEQTAIPDPSSKLNQSNNAAHTQITQSNNVFTKKNTIMMMGLIIIFALISNNLNWFSNDKTDIRYQYTLNQHQYVTRLPGLEQDPQLTADGQLLLFRYTIDKESAKSALYLKPTQESRTFTLTDNQGNNSGKRVISQRLQRAFPLTDLSNQQQFDYRYAIWSMNGRRIYAVRINQNYQCEIAELSLPASRDRIIATSIIESCHSRGHSKLSLDNEHQILYFTNRDQSRDHKLFRHDLATGKTEYLATPFHVGFGIRFIDYSAEHNKLLLLQDIGWSQTEFIQFDPITQQSTTHLSLNSVYYSAFWGPKGTDIWLNWGNDTVKAYHTTSKTMTTLLESAHGWNTAARAVNNNTAYYTVSDSNRSDLVFINSAFTSSQTPYAEEQAAFSHHSERIAFVSTEAGLQQIWLQAPQQKPIQLTNATQHFELKSLQWSFDDKYILGTAGEVLASIDIDNHRFRVHYRHDDKHGLRPFYPTWLPDNKHIVFSANDGEKWQLYQVKAEQTAQSPTRLPIDDGYITQATTQGQLLFSRYQQPGLWQYNLASQQEQQLLAELPANVYWRVFEQQLFFVATDRDDNNQMFNAIYQTPLSQYSPKKIHRLPDASNGRFDLRKNVQNGQIEFVYTDFTRKQSDLKSAKIHYLNQSDELTDF